MIILFKPFFGILLQRNLASNNLQYMIWTWILYKKKNAQILYWKGCRHVEGVGNEGGLNMFSRFRISYVRTQRRLQLDGKKVRNAPLPVWGRALMMGSVVKCMTALVSFDVIVVILKSKCEKTPFWNEKQQQR